MRSTILRALGVLVLAVALGALGGWLWWQWWGPATKGAIYDVGGPHWYDPSADGLKHDFAATAQYVVIGAGLSLFLGLVAGLLARGREILFVAVVLLGAVAGAVLTAWLGHTLGPPTPPEVAASVGNGKTYLGDLSVSRWSPYLVWPVGALAGYLVVLLSVHNMSSVPPISSGTSEFEQPRSPAAS